MKKLFVGLIVLLLLAIPALGFSFVGGSRGGIQWACSTLTGGAVGALDRINGNKLYDGMMAVVITTGQDGYLYVLDDDYGGGESSPDAILPDTNPGTKGWILITFYAESLNFSTSITIGDAGISETELEILDGATLSTAELNYLDNVTSDVQTQINAQEAELTNSAGLLAALDDETGTGVAVFSTDPTFVNSITMGSAGLTEPELEILDDATLTTVQLNYLNAATGTSGTTSTNLVFSTSPVLVTPTLGEATATSITLDASATPGWVFRDSGNPGSDKEIARIYANFLSGGDGAEDGSVFIQAMLDGTERSVFDWDSDTEALTLGDSATGEDLIIDFDSGIANEVKVSSNSGVTEIDISAINFVTTGQLHGGIETIADDTSLAATQCYGSLNKLNGAETVTLPAAVVGMNVLLYSDDATVKTIDPNGTDHIWLNGADNGAGNSIDSPGAVGDYIVLVAFSNNNWYSLGQSGTWIDTP